MIVPECLKLDGITFCKVAPGQKNPIEKNWQNKNYIWTDVEKWNPKYNVGLIGSDIFIILDIDQEHAKEVLKNLPETTECITGSGGTHAYFKTINAYSVRINDEKGNRVFDIQSTGTQALMPGSLHPNGNYYKISKISPYGVTYVDFEKILTECSKYGTILGKKEIKQHNTEKQKVLSVNTAKSKNKTNEYPFKISDVLKALGFSVSQGEGLTDTPFGISSGKKCLHYNDYSGLWYDFHNNSKTYSGTLRRLLYLLKKKNKLPDEFRRFI